MAEKDKHILVRSELELDEKGNPKGKADWIIGQGHNQNHVNKLNTKHTAQAGIIEEGKIVHPNGDVERTGYKVNSLNEVTKVVTIETLTIPGEFLGGQIPD